MTAIATQDEQGIRIEEALRLRFAERSTAAEAYGEPFAGLWRSAAAHATGGKLIRPRLLLDIHRALSPDSRRRDADTVVGIAAEIELLHYAFLLHDDVIDGDLYRRRRPNLIGTLAHDGGAADDDLHWARSSAILMGDLLLATAVLGFARARVSTSARMRLLDLIEHTIVETVAGEHIDVGLADGVIVPDLRTILAMSTYKTATYSFSLPLRAAAVLADASVEVEEDLSAIGRHLGLAFQLQDDLLCIFGDAEAHGKDPFSDLREGKETAIIAYARMTTAWSKVAPRFGSADLSADEGMHLRGLLRECGAEGFVQSLVLDELAAASEILTAAEETRTMSGDVVTCLRTLLARVEGRRS
ncbi:polyprenyl synthetase family protein [uncultured Microbacterium sp.]|uniref:polyprenyl synthetase family protein n=1 Tax=uncultured Microbacterium sp. TaxID=191216 RepID=UPI0028DCAB30|nr:polyprenyl synthetase family protein [uncultured Microbacterium sp.]